MVKMINRMTGTVMFVDDSRVNEYEAKGHATAAAAKIREQTAALEKASRQTAPARTAAKKPAAKKAATAKSGKK